MHKKQFSTRSALEVDYYKTIHVKTIYVKQHADAREGTEPQQFPLIGCSYSERSHKSKSDLPYTDYSQVVCLPLAQART